MSDRPDWLRVSADSVTLQIHARPGKAKAGFVRIDPRGLVVALSSPPEKGRANEELIALLADTLRISRSAISLIRGGSSRSKTLRIATDQPGHVAAAIESRLAHV
jgi:uncharacterized protein (TIGR00251 family)